MTTLSDLPGADSAIPAGRAAAQAAPVDPALPDPAPADAPPADPAATVADLTRLLYGQDRDRVHGPWRALAADPDMQRRTEATPAEQLADSYRRLRRLGATVDATALATDPRALAALHEWTAPLDGALTVLAGIHYNLFLGSLYDHDPRPDRPLEDFLRLARIGTFLCTELAHGNDAAALETVASYDRDQRTFTLHTPHPGAQKFMPNTGPAGGPKSGLVAARLLIEGRDHGVFLFLVPLTDATGPLPGITVRPLPLRPGSPVDHCLTSFDGVTLPRTALLTGEHGRLADDATVSSAFGSKRKRFLTAIGRVTVGKLCMAASAVGGARAALATAVRYAHHRQVTGARPDRPVPLWAFRTHHGPLLDALATAYAMTALHRSTVQRWVDHAPADAETAERQVAITKGWTTWQARELIIESRERCGAQGLLPVNGLVALVGDVEGIITAEGDNLALWAKAGAELLLSAPDTTPVPAPAADTALAPAVGTALAPAATPAADLADPAARQALLAAVGRLRLARARTRMRTAPAGDRLRRWNAAAPDALAAVTATAEHDAAAQLLALASGAEDPTARGLLLDLHRLFTLRRIETYGALLLAAGELTAAQVAEADALREESMHRLADHGTTLIAAFDLPEPLLAHRPITTPGYQRALLTHTEAVAAPPRAPEPSGAPSRSGAGTAHGSR
ncbi:acyl-CoA dehydrogenase family protein [Streptomyces sp. HSW2009]|uniref:acyl-CoA dehydrogenase family protein n=1 Tax=Streptomyces sp. HSW2009 TaxID=3142890 RepID=UPI0032F01D07